MSFIISGRHALSAAMAMSLGMAALSGTGSIPGFRRREHMQRPSLETQEEMLKAAEAKRQRKAAKLLKVGKL